MLPAGADLATNVQSMFNIAWAVRSLPEVSSAKHAEAAAELKKAVAPHLYGYNPGAQHVGCDARQLASIKLQMQGDRFLVCAPFKELSSYLAKQPDFDGKPVTYTAVRNLMRDMNVDIARSLAACGIHLFYGNISANTMLFMPAGFVLCEATSQANIGVRLSFVGAFGTKFKVGAESLHAISATLAEGMLKDSMEGFLAMASSEQMRSFGRADAQVSNTASPLSAPLPPPVVVAEDGRTEKDTMDNNKYALDADDGAAEDSDKAPEVGSEVGSVAALAAQPSRKA